MKLLTLWLCLLAVLTVTSVSAAPASLRLITVDEQPANFTRSDGSMDGFAVEIVQALQRELNDQSRLEIMPEGRALLTAQQEHNVLLFSFSRTPEREHSFHWLLPVLKKRWQIYVHPQSQLKLQSLADLRKLAAIGVVRGDVRESYLMQQGFTNLVAVTTHQQNLQMLQNERVQAIVDDGIELAYVIKEQSSPQIVPKMAMTLRTSNVYIMIRKTADPQEVARWQQAVETLKLRGDLEQIAVAWQQRIEQELHITVQREGHLLVF